MKFKRVISFVLFVALLFSPAITTSAAPPPAAGDTLSVEETQS